jgi:hypothetical protein
LSSDLGQLIPEFVPFANDLVLAAGRAGLQPRVTSTRRSSAEQTRLYNRYLAGASRYPAAPPGTSAHEFGYAFDLVTSPLEALPDVGAYWKSMGGVWFPSDEVHFEYPGFKAARSASKPDSVLDFATGFIPYVGGAQLALSVLGLVLPDLEQTEIVDILMRPSQHLDVWGAISPVLSDYAMIRSLLTQ